MDRDLRRLQRLVEAGDLDVVPSYAARLVASGQPVAAFLAVVPYMRRDQWAREIAASYAPSAIYCTLCGDNLPLHPSGFPITPTGRLSRRRRHCHHCAVEISRCFARGQFAPPDRYCRRCRAVRLAMPGSHVERVPAGIDFEIHEGQPRFVLESIDRIVVDDPRFDHVLGCLGNVNQLPDPDGAPAESPTPPRLNEQS